MSEKIFRQALIKELIQNHSIHNQENLSKALEKEGIKVTQATLSRDLHDLKVVKTHQADGYIYQIPELTKDGLIFQSNTESISFSSNLAILKTKPGFANGYAIEIDNQIEQNVVIGTVAGDDTVIVVMNENISREEFIENIKKIIPQINII